jgi:undecaprenyl diphosphate synthase
MTAPTSVPTCVGVILDGNRRWAKERGLPTLEGHRRGFENMKEFVKWVDEAGIPNAVVYAFSTENWKRSSEEVSYLMDLFVEAFGDGLDDVIARGFRVRFFGQVERLSPTLQAKIRETEAKSAHLQKMLGICVSYGGRAEILHAVNTLLAKDVDVVTEEDLGRSLWTSGMPDPDMIIRTSGEQRLSNFLTWQGVYSELFFTKTYWPAFTKEEFNAMLMEYGERERRNGK